MGTLIALLTYESLYAMQCMLKPANSLEHAHELAKSVKVDDFKIRYYLVSRRRIENQYRDSPPMNQLNSSRFLVKIKLAFSIRMNYE